MDALWQILRVKSGTEKQLALSLGAKAYVPQRPKVRYNRRHRRIVYSQEPVLSGLVFVRCADTQSVDLFLPGILGWVRKSDRGVLTLGQNDIDYMKQMEKTVWAGKSSLYDRGDRVVLKSTQFAGRDAIVIEVKKNRAVVSLIGMEIPLNVDVGALQAA